MDDVSRDLESLAVRLKEARDASRLTTRQVAERLREQAGVKVSHATIGNYERGSTVPDERLLTQLAILYSRDLEWFIRPACTPKHVRFRKADSLVRVAEEKQYLALASRWLEAYRRLEQAINRPLRDNNQCLRFEYYESGEDAAKRTRSQLDLKENQSVASVVTVMEDLFGLRVIELPTESRIDGFAAKYGNEHIVVLNPNVPNDRNRLNAGHELGHVAFSDCEDRAFLTHKEVENRAYEFAFHLLMTADVLHESFQGKSMVKLVQYKERYGVSLAAMIYRAEKKKFISTKETEWLWRQFAIRGWRKNEPGNVRPDRATRFEQLFEEAVAEQPSRRAALLRTMGVSEQEMNSRLNLAAGMNQSVEEGNGESEEGGEGGNVLKFPH